MRVFRKCISPVLAVLLMASCLTWTAAPAKAAPVDITSKFTDHKFRAVVYSMIGKTSPAAIYDTDVAPLLGLYANSKEIVSLSGIEYFTSLQTLDCEDNLLGSIPQLPASLTGLWCGGNKLTWLAPLPAGLDYLICPNNELTLPPALPAGLKEFDCTNNRLTALPPLPASLLMLWCDGNELTSLPELPHALRYLICSDNLIESLPALPPGLYELACGNNKLESLPGFVDSMYYLDCSDNLLTSLNWTGFPDLEFVNCSGNRLTALPELPAGLGELDCSNNRLTALPTLPSSLRSLTCVGNELTSLPELPHALRYLICSDNLIDSLPALPSSLIELFCSNNKLTSLPELPLTLKQLQCSDNLLTSLNLTGLSNLILVDCSGNSIPNESAVYGFSSWDGESFIFHPQNITTPSAPTDFGVSPGDSGVKMKWLNTFSSTHADDQIFIERKEGDGDFIECAALAADVSTWVDESAKGGKTYVYRLRVYSAVTDEYSDYSNEATATMPGIVAAGSMANFIATWLYTPGMFTDVDESQWYGFNNQKSIAGAYEYGLMQGAGAGIFNPTGDIKLSEAITIAVRVHVIYFKNELTLEEGELWYDGFVRYAIENGIIEDGMFAGGYERPATRAEMAYIFSRSLPEAEFEAVNAVNSLPDVGASTLYRDEIVMLYEAGVLTGNDSAGTFAPDTNIIRAQAAAIIARVILPAMRQFGNTYG
ncbi:MAG: S-layer homology domain-containing protein [Oscillospiraceae bacterium]|nr:S-layer homology domain-containing protein [Oscillospiraceae bacterium]